MKLLDCALLHARDATTTVALLACGASANAMDEYGVTPLHEAHTAEQTRLLLAAGARPDACDGAGAVALHFVRDVEQAKALLSAGAQVPDTLDAFAQARVDQAQLEMLIAQELQPRAELLAAAPAPAARPRRRA